MPDLRPPALSWALPRLWCSARSAFSAAPVPVACFFRPHFCEDPRGVFTFAVVREAARSTARDTGNWGCGGRVGSAGLRELSSDEMMTVAVPAVIVRQAGEGGAHLEAGESDIGGAR